MGNLIRTRTGVTADGSVATSNQLPVLASMRGFRPRRSCGFREFIKDCDAVVMGRTTFLSALGCGSTS
ncbi:MAG TPA: hypothetical protein VMU75_05365 [Acidimicrobiales bacterium]|nr:hypothetical protein [Acidimicrobiales bacterium]